MTSDNIIDPLTDPRVKQIESVYNRFLQTMQTLTQEQQKIIAEALTELNQKQIEEVRSAIK